MKKKILTFSEDARQAMKRGIDQIADAVQATLGPRGRNVLIQLEYGHPIVTKDGVTVANRIKLKDPIENMGASLIQQVASKTNDGVGDGPQPLYSSVLTPTGFIKMRDIKPGMDICGTNGTIQRVVDVYEKGTKDVYRVNFVDGRYVDCCKDHLWTVITDYGKRKTLTVEQIISSGRLKKVNKYGIRHGFFVQRNVVEFKEDKVPLDPYFVGVLLGDGDVSSGDVKMDIGNKKKHILDKLILPDGVNFKIKERDNYITVKFNRNPLKQLLKEADILGLNSYTKKIPKRYLYSSVKNRKALLRGLLDTDGYTNKRNRFEFSTVSSEMASSFIELCNSLGIATCSRIHRRDNDQGSYSSTPIFRITELKGDKYGLAIESIEKIGKKEKMRCIKVSNNDNLYITDGFIPTHNTTSATILTRAIVTEGLKSIVAGVNPLLLKRGLDIAKDQVIDFIKSQAKQVTENEEIKKIATISSNDEKIGSCIADMIKELGTESESVISVKESQVQELRYETVKGMKIDRGYMSGWMMTHVDEMKAELQDAPVFVTDMKITNMNQVTNILEPIAESGKRFAVIICEDMSADALSVVIDNLRKGSFFTLVIKAPSYGEQKEEILKDICAISGATECLASSGRKLENAPIELKELGTFDRIVATRDETILEGGHGKKEDIEARATSIRTMLERADSKIDIGRLKERLGKLLGGVGIIHVGGSVDVETKELYHRVEDAVGATKAAIDGGYVSGGGLTLVEASTLIKEDDKSLDDVNVGIRILRNALKYPMKIIAQNAGFDGNVVVGKVQDLDTNEERFNGIGFDALNCTYVNMIDNGIIDPAKVVISALQNAVGVASLILTTECTITEDEEDKTQNEMLN